jgi:hypothetical protein
MKISFACIATFGILVSATQGFDAGSAGDSTGKQYPMLVNGLR